MKLGWATDFPRAVEALEKAVAIDPTFAMAYRGLAVFCSNMGRSVEARRNSDKALELSIQQGRLPLREKLLIEARAVAAPQEATKAYSRLLELYPEDVPGNVNLGWILANNLGQLEKAAALYEVPVRNRLERFIPYVNLHSTYCLLGRYEDAERVLKGFIKDFPDNPAVGEAFRLLSHVHMTEADFRGALKDLEESLRSIESPRGEVAKSRALIRMLTGDFNDAAEELNSLLSEKDELSLLRVHQDLARLFRTQGRFRAARENLGQGLAFAQENRQVIYADVLIREMIESQLAAADGDGAERTISEYGSWLKEIGRDPEANGSWLTGRATLFTSRGSHEEAERCVAKYVSLFSGREEMLLLPLRIRGVMKLSKGELGTAVGLLTEAKNRLRSQPNSSVKAPLLAEHAYIMDPLADAYFRSGDLARARQEYEAITKLTTGRLAYGDIYARSFYRLGQVYEQMGKKKLARSNYRKFLELWKDADPGLAEVADAKKRLDQL